MNYENGKFYSLQEIAEDLRLPKSSLARWCREGKLQGVLFGKKWMVDGGEVERLRREGIPQDREPKKKDLKIEQEQEQQEPEPKPKEQGQEQEKESEQESKDSTKEPEPKEQEQGTEPEQEPEKGQEQERGQEPKKEKTGSRVLIKTCEFCGKEFEGKRSNGRFCSATCRQRSYSQKKRAGQDSGKE